MKQLTDEVFDRLLFALNNGTDEETSAELIAALAAAKQAQPERGPSTKGSDQVWFAQNYKQGGAA